MYRNHKKKALSLEVKIPDIPKIVIPTKECHGDLTFSNLIIKFDTIYLIDFLDSYIESPLQDIVKLRQDTYYKWSLNFLGDTEIDLVKTDIVLDYLDQYILDKFPQTRTIEYQILECINLARLLPYIKNHNLKYNIGNYVKSYYDSSGLWKIHSVSEQ